MNSLVLPELNTILISDSIPETKNQTALEAYFKTLRMATKNGKSSFQCSKNDDYGKVRYFTSAYISYIVATQSKDCGNTLTLPKLCKNTIEIAKKTFDDFVVKNQCVGKSVQPMQKSFQNSMTSIDTLENQNECISGFYLEHEQCGFLGKNEALNYCNNINSSDICCQSLNRTELAISGSVNEKKNSSNLNLVIGLSVGALVLLLLLGAFLYRRKRLVRDESRNTSQSRDLSKLEESDTVSQSSNDKHDSSQETKIRNSDQSFSISILSSVDSVDVSTIASNNPIRQETKPPRRFGNHSLKYAVFKT